MSSQGLTSLLVGRRVTALRRVLFVDPEGVRDDRHGPLEVTTEGHITALLDIGADRASLRWAVGPWQDPLAEPLSPENQAQVDRIGRWVAVAVDDWPGYADVIGRTLLAVEELWPGGEWPEPAPANVVGARLVTKLQTLDAYATGAGGFVVDVTATA